MFDIQPDQLRHSRITFDARIRLHEIFWNLSVRKLIFHLFPSLLNQLLHENVSVRKNFCQSGLEDRRISRRLSDISVDLLSYWNRFHVLLFCLFYDWTLIVNSWKISKLYCIWYIVRTPIILCWILSDPSLLSLVDKSSSIVLGVY